MQQLLQQIQQSVREVHLTVSWKDGKRSESIDVVNDVVSLGQGSDRNGTPGAALSSPTGVPGVPGAPGVPGDSPRPGPRRCRGSLPPGRASSTARSAATRRRGLPSTPRDVPSANETRTWLHAAGGHHRGRHHRDDGGAHRRRLPDRLPGQGAGGAGGGPLPHAADRDRPHGARDLRGLRQRPLRHPALPRPERPAHQLHRRARPSALHLHRPPAALRRRQGVGSDGGRVLHQERHRPRRPAAAEPHAPRELDPRRPDGPRRHRGRALRGRQADRVRLLGLGQEGLGGRVGHPARREEVHPPHAGAHHHLRGGRERKEARYTTQARIVLNTEIPRF